MSSGASRSENEVRQLAELIFRSRLRGHGESLVRVRGRVEEEAAERSATGAMARGLLVGAWVEELDRHCRGLVRDLVAVLGRFGGLASARWLPDQLEDHFDAAVETLLEELDRSRFGGVASTSAERKRVANQVAGIRSRSRQELLREIEREAGREREALAAPDASELDDRLPLARAGAFDRDLAEQVRQATDGEPLSLVMIDVDRFKSVNDRHGHPVGDEVLVEVAERVVARVGGKGRAYRYGGEELAVLLPGYSVEEAAGLAERLRKDLEAAPCSSRSLTITASFGVSCTAGAGKDPKALLEHADGALYRAKNEGRNRVRAVGAEGPVAWSLAS